MYRSLLSFVLACGATACAPDLRPAPTALDATAAAAWTGRHHQPLTTPDGAPVANLTGYLTQVIEGVDLPLATMQSKCPDKLLRAGKTPLFGLEAPYPVKRLLLAPDDLARLPMSAYTTAKTVYDGVYALVRSGDALMAVFPAGVATTTNAAGEPVPAAKLLRTFTASAGRGHWGVTDRNGRDWSGVRLTAAARFPAQASPAVTEALKTWKEAPCR